MEGPGRNSLEVQVMDGGDCVKEPALAFSLHLLSFAALAVMAGCQVAPRPDSQSMPAARTIPPSLEPSQSNSTPAVGDCGLAAFPVSMSAKEILAVLPRGAASRNATMSAKAEIDPEG